MVFKVHAEIPIDKVGDFLDRDMRKLLDEWKEETMRQIRKESMGTARNLCFARMPSYGGSYRDAIKWRRVSKNWGTIVSEMYNEHQWAQAVERGTKPHVIRSKGNWDMVTGKSKGGRPSVLADQGGKGRPYGTRYGPTVLYGRSFNHPGSRAFHIFRDTKNRVVDSFERIIETARRNVGHP